MITGNKTFRILFVVFSAVSAAAALACLIVDAALNNQLTWSGFAVFGIMFLWAAAAPLLLLKSRRLLFSLVSVSVAAIPFLFVLQLLTPLKGWFVPLGLPIALIAIAALWAAYGIIRFLRLNLWFLSASMLFLFGIAVNLSVEYVVSSFLGTNIFTLGNIISFCSTIAIVVLLCIIGIKERSGKR